MKLSIITINLNNIDGLNRTIKSVIEQSYTEYEYIIIDGASTDGSIELIKQFSDNITYWKSESDKGIYNAMNKGIQKATGDYCYFLNSGDTFYNKSVLEEIMKIPIIGDIVCFDAIVNEGDKNSLVKASVDISFYMFYTHTILHQSAFIQRSLFEKYGLYNEQLRIVSDWEFFIKVLFLYGATYQSVSIILSVFDTTGLSSIPANFLVSKEERTGVLNKYFLHFLPDYELIKEKSLYNFLKNLRKNRVLSYFFILNVRIFNKITKILKG